MINGPGEKIVRDPRLTSNPTNHPSCICQRGAKTAPLVAHILKHANATSGQGLGYQGGCYRSCQLAAHAHAFRVWGVRGDVIVHVNLTRTHMLHHARVCSLVWGVRGVLSFMSTWRARTCYITPGFWGVRGGVIVHVNLPHTHMRRHARVDAMWRSKSAIPCSLAARVNS